MRFSTSSTIVERAVHRFGIKARSFNSLLRVHAQVDDVEEDLQERLVLAVASWRGKRQPRLSVFHNDSYGYRRPSDLRSLAMHTANQHIIKERRGMKPFMPIPR